MADSKEDPTQTQGTHPAAAAVDEDAQLILDDIEKFYGKIISSDSMPLSKQKWNVINYLKQSDSHFAYFVATTFMEEENPVKAINDGGRDITQIDGEATKTIVKQYDVFYKTCFQSQDSFDPPQDLLPRVSDGSVSHGSGIGGHCLP